MKGFVGYFDILGFSELLRLQEAEVFEKKFDQYCDILNDATSREKRELDYTFFSDSVMINTQSEDLEELLNISKAISEITYRLTMELDVTICGCISFGSFTKRRDNGNAMMTGTPILKAIQYEKLQNWIGTMLSPSVFQNFRHLKDILNMNPPGPDSVEKICDNISWLTTIQYYDKIPFPDGPYSGFVIVPRNRTNNYIQDINQDYLMYRNKLRELSLFAPNIYAQKKYRESCHFIESVADRWTQKIISDAYGNLNKLYIE